MDINKMSKIPDSILNDVTDSDKNKTSANQPKPDNVPPIAGNSSVSETDILKGAEHTKISSLLSGDNPTNPNQSQANANPINTGNSVAIGSLIEGKLAIELIDSMLPALLVAGLYAINIKVRKTELQLTEKEKGVIAPILQNCLNTLNINFNNPWQTLAFTMAVIYGSKISEKGLVAWIDKMNEKKEKEIAVKESNINPTPLPTEVTKADSLAQKSFNDFQKVASTVPMNVPTYTLAEVERFKKEKKVGHDRAIKMLNKKYNLPETFKPAA